MTARPFIGILIVFVTVVSAQTPAQPPAAQGPPPAACSPPATSTAPSTSCPEVATVLMALMRADARLRDWPDLTRYREANRALAAPAAGETRVVFMGDSITDGWEQPRYGGFFPGKAVVILAGTNDIAGNTGVMTNEEIQGNLASMSELAHAHKIKVVMSSVTPVSEYHVANPRVA